MRFDQRQRKYEELVFEALAELSEILNIDLNTYPEVYWMGKNLDFNELGIPSYLKDELEFRRHFGISYYITQQRIVMIGKHVTDHTIFEESSHAFHFLASGISYANKTTQEIIIMACIVEMMGMLGARLLGSDLENPYEDFPDLSRLPQEAHLKVNQSLIEKFGDGHDVNDFFIHQQGYGLADRIYVLYELGYVNIDQIRRLFLHKFDGPTGVSGAFVRLKNKYWPHESK